MKIIHNPNENGLNVHERSSRIGGNDAHVSCRSIVYLHDCDFADPLRLGRARIRDPRHPSRHWIVQAGGLIKVTVVALALLPGVLFAMPASAFTGVLFDSINATAGTSSDYGVVGRSQENCNDGQGSIQRDYGYSFNYSSSSNVVIAKVEILFGLSSSSTKYTSRLSWRSSLGQTGYGYAIGDTTTTYTMVPAAYGNDITFTFSPSLGWADNWLYGVTGRSAYTTAFPEISNQKRICNSNGYVLGVVARSQFGVPPIRMTGAYFGQNSAESEQGSGNASTVPTSTYDGAFSSSVPGFNWGSTTGSATTTGTLVAHLNSMLGSSTSSFPMCVVYPWFVLSDMVEGQTLATQTAQTIVIQGAGIVPTSTFDLAGFNDVAAKTGFKNPFEMLLGFLEPLAWLSLGVSIFIDLFGNKGTSDPSSQN